MGSYTPTLTLDGSTGVSTAAVAQNGRFKKRICSEPQVFSDVVAPHQNYAMSKVAMESTLQSSTSPALHMMDGGPTDIR